MPLRKTLLRLMLISLAICAGAGILAVLVVGDSEIGRIVGTGILLGISFGLMLAVSLLIDKPITRWAGIVGICSCGVGALLMLDLIWGDLVFGRNWRVTENLVVSAWAVVVYGAIAACNVAGVGVERRWWRWIGVVATGAAFVIAVVAVWTQLQTVGLEIAVATGIAVVVAHANVVFMCNLANGQQLIRLATVAAVVVDAVLVDILFTRPAYLRSSEDPVARAVAATSIAGCCGTLAILVLARLNRKNITPAIPAGVKELAIVCPWCTQKQTVPLGGSSCTTCGLKFQIAVEEPRCPNCDYLLFMLNSPNCPECGMSVKAPAEGTPAAAT